MIGRLIAPLRGANASALSKIVLTSLIAVTLGLGGLPRAAYAAPIPVPPFPGMRGLVLTGTAKLSGKLLCVSTLNGNLLVDAHVDATLTSNEIWEETGFACPRYYVEKIRHTLTGTASQTDDNGTKTSEFSLSFERLGRNQLNNTNPVQTRFSDVGDNAALVTEDNYLGSWTFATTLGMRKLESMTVRARGNFLNCALLLDPTVPVNSEEEDEAYDTSADGTDEEQCLVSTEIPTTPSNEPLQSATGYPEVPNFENLSSAPAEVALPAPESGDSGAATMPAMVPPMP